MSPRLPLLALGLAASAAFLGCHRPQGAFMSYTGASQTYYSYEMQPKTVRIIDRRADHIRR